MSPLEVAALQPIRRHREAQAERAWFAAQQRLQGLTERVERAQVQLEQAGREQAVQRAELARAHQGRALSPSALTTWAAQEQGLLGQLAAEANALEDLRRQRAEHYAQALQARQRLRERQRALEKIKELTTLLAQSAEASDAVEPL